MSPFGYDILCSLSAEANCYCPLLLKSSNANTNKADSIIKDYGVTALKAILGQPDEKIQIYFPKAEHYFQPRRALGY